MQDISNTYESCLRIHGHVFAVADSYECMGRSFISPLALLSGRYGTDLRNLPYNLECRNVPIIGKLITTRSLPGIARCQRHVEFYQIEPQRSCNWSQMDTYRKLQAERWKRLHGETLEQPQAKPSLIRPLPSLLTPAQQQDLAVVAVDESSLNSIKSYLSPERKFRNGILFGTVEDNTTVIVDAIYEMTQDNLTGEPLLDSRIAMVRNLSKLMGLQPVGLLVTGDEVKASHLCQLLRLEGAISHVLLLITEESTKAIIPTVECFNHMRAGELTADTTLLGRTHGGGLDGKRLQREAPVVKRTVNTIVHTGFYRLNRANHTITMNDARAFILVRREKAKIKELHLQLADYHLILWIGDTMGENTAERVIIAIHQEDDSLIEDLVELLLSSNNDL